MRVIQWATGSLGRTTLRRIIDSPNLELVGLYVTSPAKVGADAGKIAKRPDTGIVATDNIEEILKLDADVVLHTSLIGTPYEAQNDEVARLLASGKSVISPNGFYRPHIHGAAYAQPLLAAAHEGNSTLAGTGLNPGFIAERLALTATGLVAKLNEIRCFEVVDASPSLSPGLLFDAMGFGTDPRQRDLTTGPIADLYSRYFAETFDYIAEKLGTSVASITPEHELTLAPHDIVLAAGTIPQGTVAATLWRWRGVFENGIRMLHSILWTSNHALHSEEAHAHWRVELVGRPCVHLTMDLVDPDPEVPPSRAVMDATAALLVGAIPDVVAAKPGFYDLPSVLPYRG